MLARETAQARSSAYQLFSGLYLRGVTAAALPYLAAIPELAAPAGGFAPEAAAAEHYHLFGLNVFPCASIFLDESNLLGGRVTDAAAAFYQRVGFVASGDEQPDHLGVELALLAFLCAAEGEALEDGESGQAARMRDLQRRFLEGYLLPWVVVVAEAIREQEQPFYAALADLTLALVTDHYAGLHAAESGPALQLQLPAPPGLLGDDKTSLKDIADYLLTPAYSGWYLSRGEIARLGRAHDLPRGFGDRATMLANLLRAAADYEKLAEVLRGLEVRARRWAAAYRGGAAVLPYMAEWAARAETTGEMLRQLEARSGL